MIHKNYIDGQWVDSLGNQRYSQYNPADLSQVTGEYPLSTVEDTRMAIAAAQKAFPSWSALSVYERGEYLKRVLQLMKERVEEIASVITAENGKTLAESRGEINSAIAEMEFQIHQGLRMGGEIQPCRQAGLLAYQIRRPLGPVGVIAPWNFPFNVPARKMTPALMAGNTCILKSANLTPGSGEAFIRLFADAGLPAGVVNLVSGSGRVVGEELVSNPAIQAITFTGSTEVGRSIHLKAAAAMKRTQLEMGGKNPQVVMQDADIAAAAKAAVLAAFSCAGQWCISTSRAIVQKSVLQSFTDHVLAYTKNIVVGRGDDPAATMGPVCGQVQCTSVLEGIQKAKAEGATLLYGGNQITTGHLAKGCFIEPTIFTDVRPEMSVAQEEIFGPVLGILAVDTLDEAIEIANGVKYGLGASIYTNNLSSAMRFTERIDAGLTHVNMHTAYKEPQLSFGGVKESGHGVPEAGKTGFEFFTEHKTVYIHANNNV